MTKITLLIKGERREYLINGSWTTDYIFKKKVLDVCPIPYPRGIDPLIIKWKGEIEGRREGGRQRRNIKQK